MDGVVRQRVPIKNLFVHVDCLHAVWKRAQQVYSSRSESSWGGPSGGDSWRNRYVTGNTAAPRERERGIWNTHTNSQTLVWLRREGLMIRGGPSLMCNNICLEVSHSVAPLAPKNHPMWMQPEAVHKLNKETHTQTTAPVFCLYFWLMKKWTMYKMTINQNPLKTTTPLHSIKHLRVCFLSR